MTPIQVAESKIGLQEHRDSVQLMDWFKKYNVTNPEYLKEIFNPDGKQKHGLPWCAVFVTCCFKESGKNVPIRYNARGFLNAGISLGTNPKKALKGDVVVFKRGNNSYSGHVAFFDSYDPNTGYLKVLGGNQQDSVSYAYYKPDNLLGIQRI